MGTFRRLQGILDGLPELDCTGACARVACRDLTVSALEATWARREANHTYAQTPAGKCSALDEAGRCGVYAQRPLVCRLWGLLPAMACPHGCRPERWLTASEAVEVLQAVEALDLRARDWRRIGEEPDPRVTLALIDAVVGEQSAPPTLRYLLRVIPDRL